MAHGSRKAVLTAIVTNGAVTLIKFLAALAGGSASMMNEAVHSLMDTLNQGFLYRGLVVAERPADRLYAFGHGQKKYLWNLWSAIGLFSIGCGLGLSHAWHSYQGLHGATQTQTLLWDLIPPLWLNLGVLSAATLLEGYSFVIAAREFFARMRREGRRNPFAYLLRADDPTLVAVVLEDSVAMLGLTLAACGIIVSAVTGNPLWDIGFSAAIAVLLGLIAFYLGYVNMRFLADVRNPAAERAFAEIAGAHAEVERFHDLRSILLDERHTVLVAEVELREEAVVAGLRERIARHRQALAAQLPAERQHDEALAAYIDTRAAVQATLERTEEIIHELEGALRRKVPQVSHATIEVRGIVAPASETD